jgi:hypothetical protein
MDVGELRFLLNCLELTRAKLAAWFLAEGTRQEEVPQNGHR